MLPSDPCGFTQLTHERYDERPLRQGTAGPLFVCGKPMKLFGYSRGSREFEGVSSPSRPAPISGPSQRSALGVPLRKPWGPAVHSRKEMRRLLQLVPVLFVLEACAPGVVAKAPPAPLPTVRTDTQIITPDEGESRQGLVLRAKRALLEGRWQDAVNALETLRAAGRFEEGGDPDAPTLLFDLGLAYEGTGNRERARDLYHEVATRFSSSSNARTALLREAAMHADLEEWGPLGEAADALLLRKDLDAVDHMSAVGSRALSHIELGDDVSAMREVQSGLDEMEVLGF